MSNAAVLILVATAIGGGSGYLLTILAGVRLGPSGYVGFAVFWSSLYLVIATLTGVQQEVSRAARRRSIPGGSAVARNFGVTAAFVVAASAVASAPIWSPYVFPNDGWVLVAPLAFGIASYVLTAVLAGVLYGLRLWTIIAAMIALDGILRLTLTAAALAFTSDMAILSWAVALPFFMTPAILWIWIRNRLVGRFELDVEYRELAGNVARTLPGSAATGILISGFPVLLGATSPGVPPATLAAFVFAINLARAPLVIVVLSLQSYLVVTFRRAPEAKRSLLVLLSGTAITAGVLGLAAWWLGSPILEMNFGPGLAANGAVLGAVVASGGVVGMLCITGSAVIASARHLLYSAGWVVAAVSVFVVLALPVEFQTRAVIALFVGPSLGLVVHIVGLAKGPARAG